MRGRKWTIKGIMIDEDALDGALMAENNRNNSRARRRQKRAQQRRLQASSSRVETDTLENGPIDAHETAPISGSGEEYNKAELRMAARIIALGVVPVERAEALYRLCYDGAEACRGRKESRPCPSQSDLLVKVPALGSRATVFVQAGSVSDG